MSKKATGSSPTSKANRREARAKKFKNTTEAREAGVYLPNAATRKASKAQQEKVDLESTRPKVNPQKQANRAIEDEKKKGR